MILFPRHLQVQYTYVANLLTQRTFQGRTGEQRFGCLQYSREFKDSESQRQVWELIPKLDHR